MLVRENFGQEGERGRSLRQPFDLESGWRAAKRG